MPLINVDAKALEWMCVTHLSKDEVAIKEWEAGVDLHSVNQEHFKLPTRLIAKTYLFRLIYGGSAYAYAKDPFFQGVSTDVEYWQDVINQTYKKYQGLAKWHESIVLQVMETGQLEMPTGRIYKFTRKETPFGPEWPRTQILNYPVQGLGADIMMLARIDLYLKLKKYLPFVKFRGTVHDSIIFDSSLEDADNLISEIQDTWERLPSLYTKQFKDPFNLKCRCEIKVGNNLTDMEEI